MKLKLHRVFRLAALLTALSFLPPVYADPPAIGFFGAGSSGTTNPGGTSGQVEYNNAGSFGGFTVGGDATLNTGTGSLTVTKTNGVAFATSATTNTTNAANITSGNLPTAQLPTLTSTDVWVGNGSSVATAVAISGDATLANTGALSVTKTGGVAFATSATTNACNATNITSGQLPAAQMLALPSGDLYVGNVSSNPAAVALSGDATLATGGALTLATVNSNVGTFASPSSVTVNAKGLITAITAGSASALSWTISAQATNFSVGTTGTYYRVSANANITLPAATGTGHIYKFKQTGGTGTFVFNGTDKLNHANGTQDALETINSNQGVLELIDAASGQWDET